jgi:hypothetical protein
MIQRHLEHRTEIVFNSRAVLAAEKRTRATRRRAMR